MTSDRTRNIATSPTLAITAKANRLKAAGQPVIGFGAGEPDFPTPPHVVKAAQAACADPAAHRYSPAAGIPELREAVAQHHGATAEQVVISNGGKHSLYNAFMAILDPGDEVLLPAPYWVSYPEQIRLAGGNVVTIDTAPEDGFRATVDQLGAAVTDRTKALVFVSPSNPTGAVYDPDEVEAVGRWAAERGIWVITDEIYEHLIYGDAQFVSMPQVAPEVASRCIVSSGVSKTYAMTGWRVGWTVSPPEVAAAIGRLQSHTTSNVANVCQQAALAALEGPQDAVEQGREVFDRRRRVAVEALSAIGGVGCVEPRGAFYVFPDFRGVLGRTVAGREVASTLELADVMLDEAHVALVPGEAFGAPGFMRLSYALGDAELEEGLGRIGRLLD